MKREFTEFKKISLAWIGNKFGSLQNLIDETNKNLGLEIKYNPHHRSSEQKKLQPSIHQNIVGTTMVYKMLGLLTKKNFVKTTQNTN